MDWLYALRSSCQLFISPALIIIPSQPYDPLESIMIFIKRTAVVFLILLLEEKEEQEEEQNEQ